MSKKAQRVVHAKESSAAATTVFSRPEQSDFKVDLENYKMSKPQKQFIFSKVRQWQEYLKSTKHAKLGYSKRELSKINVETVSQKCIELNFDEERYKEWFSTIETQDEWVASNVAKE